MKSGPVYLLHSVYFEGSVLARKCSKSNFLSIWLTGRYCHISALHYTRVLMHRICTQLCGEWSPNEYDSTHTLVPTHAVSSAIELFCHEVMKGNLLICRHRLQSSWGQHGAHLGPTGPRWAPCWSHELCNQGKSIHNGPYSVVDVYLKYI